MKLSAAHLLFLALQCPLLAHAADVLPPQLPVTEDSRLVSVATSAHIWNGVTVAPDGRTFVSLTQSEGPGVSLAEIGQDGQLHPYPDAQWNSWDATNPGNHFLHVNALRIGLDGKLWAVDAGNTGINTGAHAVPGAGKLVKIDLATNTVEKVYPLAGDVQKDNSYFDDIRFHGDLAYLTDPGAVRLVVLDLKTGKARTVLEGHELSIDHLPMYADGKKLFIPNGQENASGSTNWKSRPTANTCITRPFLDRWRASKPATSTTPNYLPPKSPSTPSAGWTPGVPAVRLSTRPATCMPLM